MTATIILALIVLGLLWRLREQDRETLDRLAEQAQKWLAERDRTATAHRDQLQTLLNQIKPDTAQPVIPEGAVSPPAVNLFDDDAYWESREAFAERQMAEELANGR